MGHLGYHGNVRLKGLVSCCATPLLAENPWTIGETSLQTKLQTFGPPRVRELWPRQCNVLQEESF